MIQKLNLLKQMLKKRVSISFENIEKKIKKKEKKGGYCVTLHPGSNTFTIQFSRDFERRQWSWTYNHGPVGPLSRSKLRNLLSCISSGGIE
jgi:hypothetical protein